MRRRRGRKSGSGQEGFTLVELLVVITLIGLIASVVTLSTGGLRPTDARAEADKLYNAFRRAQEAAVLGNRAIAVRVDRMGYSFETRRLGSWQSLAAAGFPRGLFGPDVEARVGNEGVMSVVFDNTGQTTPAHLVLARGAKLIAIDLDASGKASVHALDPS